MLRGAGVVACAVARGAGRDPRDPNARPIHLVHILKLFHDGSAQAASSAERPVVAESYDEVVFNELPADPALRAAIVKGPVVDPPAYPHQEHLTLWSHESDLASLKAARAWVRERMEEQEDRLSQRKAESAALKKHLGDLGML